MSLQINQLFNEIVVEKIKIFNYDIIKCKIPKHFYESKLLKESIDKVFESRIVIDNCHITREQTGKAYSTVNLGKSIVTNLNDINPLIDCISFIILKNFYKNYSVKKNIFFNRMWMNKMYKECSGKCHSHNSIFNDGTAVFYYDVSKNGSQLIILKEKIDGDVKKKHHKIAHYIPVETGDLIIHDKSIFHAVSKHMNDIPRICFVFDFKLNNNLKINYS